uniref:DUF992 domain-containing protein n=1 Tax=Caulobacter sp. S45 TaxID=1641861 RepID=UPI001577524D
HDLAAQARIAATLPDAKLIAVLREPASATLGVGIGGNALVGGSSHSFSLQPFSIEGSTGVNVAAGIGGLDLYYVPNFPMHRHHRRPHGY